MKKNKIEVKQWDIKDILKDMGDCGKGQLFMKRHKKKSLRQIFDLLMNEEEFKMWLNDQFYFSLFRIVLPCEANIHHDFTNKNNDEIYKDLINVFIEYAELQSVITIKTRKEIESLSSETLSYFKNNGFYL